MNLRRWEIVFVPADAIDAAGHPAVVLSSEDILEDPHQLRFNVVIGIKKPPAAPVMEHHVLLDAADGLGFLTVLDCSLVYMVRKSSVLRVVGSVSLPRRNALQRKIRSCLGLG